MRAITITPVESARIKAKTAKPLLWIAMVSMSMLFAGLTSAYIVSQADGNWLRFALPEGFYFSTGIIVLSSIALIWTLRSARNNNFSKTIFWTGITFLLGLGFVFSQFASYRQLIDMGIFFGGSQSNASGSFLYVLTGLHLAHLFGGLIVLLVVLINATLKKYNSENILGLQLCSIYWHFLSVLWIYLFLFLLLIR